MGNTRIIGTDGDTSFPNGTTRKISVETNEIPLCSSATRKQPLQNVSATGAKTVYVNRGAVSVPASSIGSAKTVLVGMPRIQGAGTEGVVQGEGAPAAAAPAQQSARQVDPVVGWLVAMDGPMKGMFFALGAGQNTIGRDPQSNRVCVPDDPGVSRNGHVIIIYDPRRVTFVVRPGTEGTGITDLNDELLDNSRTLHHGDRLRLTDQTTLCFVPFCTPECHW